MSLSLQHQIKNNSTDIRSYIEDLYKWEDQKKEKPKATIQVKAKIFTFFCVHMIFKSKYLISYISFFFLI